MINMYYIKNIQSLLIALSIVIIHSNCVYASAYHKSAAYRTYMQQKVDAANYAVVQAKVADFLRTGKNFDFDMVAKEAWFRELSRQINQLNDVASRSQYKVVVALYVASKVLMDECTMARARCRNGITVQNQSTMLKLAKHLNNFDDCIWLLPAMKHGDKLAIFNVMDTAISSYEKIVWECDSMPVVNDALALKDIFRRARAEIARNMYLTQVKTTGPQALK